MVGLSALCALSLVLVPRTLSLLFVGGMTFLAHVLLIRGLDGCRVPEEVRELVENGPRSDAKTEMILIFQLAPRMLQSFTAIAPPLT